MSIFDKIFDKNKMLLKKYSKVVDKINSLEPSVSKLPQEEFLKRTEELKKAAESGPLEDLIPEAFALVREAAKRTTGMRAFDVQLMGAMALNEGKIAEMKTGEGKTLVATMPLYLNALTGKGCHLATVNDYLAKRDAGWMGPVYEYLGMKAGFIQASMD
ncbi:MAG TPA: preprotein translocase subunit SecA, partial [Mesotoga sp.]|nr:preprotein translocase subunit SecA [Mesotoga sp.]